MTAPRDPNQYGQGSYSSPQQAYGAPQYGPIPGYGQPAYGPPPTYAPPPKKSSGGKVALIVIGVFVGICLVAGVIGVAINGGGDDGKATTVSPKLPSGVSTTAAAAAPATTAADDSQGDGKVTFRVTGSGSARMTWIDSKFQSSQETGALPWTKTITSDDSPGVNIAAQRQSGGGGSISCEILHNGKVIAKNTASGPYAVVSCVISFTN